LIVTQQTSPSNDTASKARAKRNFSDASDERFYSDRTNRMMSPSDARDLGRVCNSLFEF